MATTFESISLNGLRLSHLRQLSSYVHDRDRDGWYYGHKDQFEKRHAELVKWIDSAVQYAESEDVKMPNNKINRTQKDAPVILGVMPSGRKDDYRARI